MVAFESLTLQMNPWKSTDSPCGCPPPTGNTPRTTPVGESLNTEAMLYPADHTLFWRSSVTAVFPCPLVCQVVQVWLPKSARITPVLANHEPHQAYWPVGSATIP